MLVTGAAERAVELFVSGFNCAEATLLALSEEFGKKVSVIPRIATGFGGGIGRTGQLCGALSGAVMAIGLQVGCDRAEEKEKRSSAAEGVRQMIVGFEEEFGTTQCRVLTGCVLHTKEGREKFDRLELRKTFCPRLIRWTVDYVAEKYR